MFFVLTRTRPEPAVVTIVSATPDNAPLCEWRTRKAGPGPRYGSRVRNGVPLPGRTPQQVVSQLVYRVLGPLRPDRIRWVLDYHGLAGHPAAAPDETAQRCGVTVGMLRVHTGKVRAAGAALPLRPAVVAAAIRGSTPGEDHLGRVRIARTLRLPAPRKPPPPPRPPRADWQVDPRTAQAAMRVLAAVGPLDPAALLGAVTRCQRFRGRHPPTTDALSAALTTLGAARDDQGRLHAPPGSPVPDRYRAILSATGASRDLTRQDMIDILTAAGYTDTSAAGLIATTHPLFTRTGPNRYRILGVPRAQR